MRQHHTIGVTTTAHLDDGVCTRLEGGADIEPESVHPQDETLVREGAQVVYVGTVAGMAQDHSLRVNTLFIA